MENRKYFSKIGFIMFIGTIIIIASQLLVAQIVAKIPAIAESGSLSFVASMLPMYIIGFTAVFFMFRKVPAEPVKEKKKMRPLHVFVAFLMCYAGTYIVNIIVSIPIAIISILASNPSENVVMNVTDSVNPLTNFLILVICAPIMEELLFRKVIIDRTVKYGEGVAIAVSSIMFALFHGNLAQFCYVLVLGFFTGLLYVKTGNIKYSIMIHMLLNFMGAFVSSLVLEAIASMEMLNTSLVPMTDAEAMALMMNDLGVIIGLCVYALVLIGFVIAGVALFCVNVRKIKLYKREDSIEKGKYFKTIFLNVGMILYSVFWIGMIVFQLVG